MILQAEMIGSDRFRIFGKLYSSVFPIDRLPGWIAFYDRMAKRYAKKRPDASANYSGTADALRAFQRGLAS